MSTLALLNTNGLIQELGYDSRLLNDQPDLLQAVFLALPARILRRHQFVPAAEERQGRKCSIASGERSAKQLRVFDSLAVVAGWRLGKLAIVVQLDATVPCEEFVFSLSPSPVPVFDQPPDSVKGAFVVRGGSFLGNFSCRKYRLEDIAALGPDFRIQVRVNHAKKEDLTDIRLVWSRHCPQDSSTSSRINQRAR